MIYTATNQEITAILDTLGMPVPAKKAARKVIGSIRNTGLYWIAVRGGLAFVTDGETAIVVPTKSPDQNIPLSSAVVDADAVDGKVEILKWHMRQGADKSYPTHAVIGAPIADQN